MRSWSRLSNELWLMKEPGDAVPKAGLAPKIGEKDRAACLTRLVYADSMFDPAVTAHV
ncbi:MAG: hypothetical protein ABL956_17225 [Hyphomonadaceae bacterium]